MLTLNDGRKEMYQWDIGRIATVDVVCDFVHFSNLKYGGSLSVEVKNREVAIPNKLLTSGEPIYCWAFVADENGNYTKQEQTLNVNKRAKPSDYVYTETETLTWKSLDERITELEKGGTGGGSGDMQKSVYDPNNNAKDIFKYADDAAKLAVTNHALSNTAHSDIRGLITGLTNRLNALADSDDTTLDQLSEIVAYIKSNKSLIDAITTEKVSVSDIIDNLTTNDASKPLSAAQGVALKALIDGITIPEKLPNPNALTFTGAVTGSYDGSSPLTVNIQSGGSGTAGYPVVVMTASAAELTPNTYYRWGEISALTVTLAEPADTSVTNEYCFEFVSGETATTLSVPNTVKWVKEPNVEAGKTYQVSILDGIGVICGA